MRDEATEIASFPHRLVVDGELWEISRDDLGQFRYSWLSGLVGGSGFTSRFSVAVESLPAAFCEETIRDYMANVNPETGYLD